MRLSLSLGRYLTTMYLRWFVGLYLGIVALAALIDLTELLRLASSKPHITTLIIVKMVILHLPFLGAKLMPFIVLFTTFMVLWKLNSASELTVMRAAGMSIQQILLPLVLTVMAISCVELFVFNPITSTMTERYERIRAYQLEGKKRDLTVVASGMWARHAKNYPLVVLKFKGVDLKKQMLHDVMLFTYDDNDTVHTRYHAKTLNFSGDDTLLLKEGWSIPHTGPIQQFQTYHLKSDLDISIIQNNQPLPETISFWNLPDYIQRLNQSGLSGYEYSVYWYSLTSQVLLLLSMVLLAGAFSFKPLRQRGVMVLISVGLSIGFVLYILRDITAALGSVGTLPPILAAWIPSLISFLCGAVLIIYQEDR